MTALVEQGISRRRALRIIGGTLLDVAVLSSLSSCQWLPEASPVLPKERENRPQLGDVIKFDGSNFLLGGNGKRYPFRSENEVDRYIVASKLREYERRVFSVSDALASRYPIGQRSDDVFLVNPFTGLPIGNQMGEVILPWMGMLSREGSDSYNIRPASFPEITLGLLPQNWRDSQSLLFTYGNRAFGKSVDEALKEGGFGYNALDTLRSLDDLFANADQYYDYIQEALPFCQINPIAHSLGGVLAMREIMRHPESVNCAVFISSPVRGIRKSIELGMIYDFFRNNASKWDIKDKFVNGILALVGDLFALWDNKEYQKKLDEFTTRFVASGRRIVNIVVENDLIVPVESTRIKGATEIRIKSQSELNLIELIKRVFGPQEDLISYALALWNAHGLGLKHPRSMQAIREALDYNLSFPIGDFKPNIPRFPLEPDFK